MALTAQELQELREVANDDSLPIEARQRAADLMLRQAQSPQTLPNVAQQAQAAPVPVPEGRAQELQATAEARAALPPAGGPNAFAPMQVRPPAVEAQQQVRDAATAQGFIGRIQQFTDFGASFFTGEERDNERREERVAQRARDTLALYQDAQTVGVDREQVQNRQSAGSFAADVAASGPATLPRTILGRIAGEVAMGTIAGASAGDVTGDALMAGAAGALGSGVIGTLSEVPNVARAALANDVLKAGKQKFGGVGNVTRDPYNVTEGSRTTGIPLTLGESTQSSRLRNLEAQVQQKAAVGGPAESFTRKRQAQAVENFAKVVDVIDPDKLSTRAVINGLKGVQREAVRATQKAASDNFRNSLEPALQELNSGFDEAGNILPGLRLIRTDNMQAALEDVLGSATARIGGNPAKAKWARDTLDRLASQPRMDLEEYRQTIRALSEGAVSSDFHVNTKRLVGSLNADLDASIAALPEGSPTRGGLTTLRRVNQQYAEDIAPVDELNAVFAQKLGLDDPGLSPEEFSKRFGGLPPSQKSMVFETISNTSPELSKSLTARYFAETVEANKKFSATRDFTGEPLQVVDLQSLASNVSKMSKADLEVFMNTPNISAEQTAYLKSAFDVLSKLQGSANVGREVAGKSAARLAEDVSINIMERNAGFMSRFASGELTPGFLEGMLYTEEGINALLDVGRASLRPKTAGAQASVQSAIQSMINIDQAHDEQLRLLEEQVRQSRQQDSLDNRLQAL